VTILAAILWLAPYVGQERATSYAAAIEQTSARHDIDPLLVVALMYRESRFNPRAYSRGNFGLMQVRVTRKRRPRWVERWREVLRPRTNIRLGVAELAMWRSYHRRKCRGAHHPWYAHYQHGRRVRSLGSAKRVGAVYNLIMRVPKPLL
jgi:soluble lytic murein transglycosylase-like protein